MAALQKRKILYFIEDMVPTQADVAAIEALGQGVVIRNATYVDENPVEGQIEKCDAVAGHAPKPYRERFKYIGEEPAKTELVKTEDTPPPAPPAPAPVAENTPPVITPTASEPAAGVPAAPAAAPAAPAFTQPATGGDGWATPPAPPAPPAA